MFVMQAKREAAAAAAAALSSQLAYIDPRHATALAESIRERAAEAFEDAKDWQPAGLRVLEDAVRARVQVRFESVRWTCRLRCRVRLVNELICKHLLQPQPLSWILLDLQQG